MVPKLTGCRVLLITIQLREVIDHLLLEVEEKGGLVRVKRGATLKSEKFSRSLGQH